MVLSKKYWLFLFPVLLLSLYISSNFSISSEKEYPFHQCEGKPLEKVEASQHVITPVGLLHRSFTSLISNRVVKKLPTFWETPKEPKETIHFSSWSALPHVSTENIFSRDYLNLSILRSRAHPPTSLS